MGQTGRFTGLNSIAQLCRRQGDPLFPRRAFVAQLPGVPLRPFAPVARFSVPAPPRSVPVARRAWSVPDRGGLAVLCTGLCSAVVTLPCDVSVHRPPDKHRRNFSSGGSDAFNGSFGTGRRDVGGKEVTGGDGAGTIVSDGRPFRGVIQRATSNREYLQDLEDSQVAPLIQCTTTDGVARCGKVGPVKWSTMTVRLYRSLDLSTGDVPMNSRLALGLETALVLYVGVWLESAASAQYPSQTSIGVSASATVTARPDVVELAGVVTDEGELAGDA